MASTNSCSTTQHLRRRSTHPLPPPPVHLNRVSQSLQPSSSSCSAHICDPQQPALSTPEKDASSPNVSSHAAPNCSAAPTSSSIAATSEVMPTETRSSPPPQLPAAACSQRAHAVAKCTPPPTPPRRPRSAASSRKPRQPQHAQSTPSDSSTLTRRTRHKWRPAGAAPPATSGRFWGSDRISAATQNLIQNRGIPFSFHKQRKYQEASAGPQRSCNSTSASCHPPVPVVATLATAPFRRVSSGATNSSFIVDQEPPPNAVSCSTLNALDSSLVVAPTPNRSVMRGASQPLPPPQPLHSSPPRVQHPTSLACSQPLPTYTSSTPLATPATLDSTPPLASGEPPPWNSNTEVDSPNFNSFSSFPCPKPGNPAYTRTAPLAGVRQPPPVGRTGANRASINCQRLSKTPASHSATAVSPSDDSGAVPTSSMRFRLFLHSEKCSTVATHIVP
jgi:hypothetical protein